MALMEIEETMDKSQYRGYWKLVPPRPTCIPLILLYFCMKLADHANGSSALDTALASLPIGLETKAAGLGQSWQESPYVGPGSEVDAAWDELTHANRVFVTEDEVSVLGAAHLGIKTQDPTTEVWGYTAGVEVFYQLRCLDLLRREAHGSGRMKGDTEIDYCVEQLREALMCHSDDVLIPTTKGAADESGGEGSRPLVGVEGNRQCRSFEGLKRWTHEHSVESEETK
ncbi:hypothetical protein B0J18DRAFT_465731 [Chaetomium sp. MPI-SDFR-AT-0129]|nr:hypothetical protein B0J18DRAFT_465731 [Chaetomium sp. MPI-SDFR-AT-0129]